MMKTILTIFLIVGFVSCRGQKNDESLDKMGANEPKVSWDVKTEVDEDGNVTRYDSTYTWSYSNMEGDRISIDVDSVMRSFDSYFDRRLPSIWDENFMNPLSSDSLLNRDFFNDDFFHNRWKQNFFDMDKMFRRMDSIRNEFFRDEIPHLNPDPNIKKS